jgi:hypothetical protein
LCPITKLRGMKKLAGILFLSVTLLSCEEGFDSVVPCDEGVEATVRDLAGLDGCGFVFVLNDGRKLEPYLIGYCGTPPIPKEVTEDPLYGFEWRDGKKVKIGYTEMPERNGVCMAGLQVKITCLEEEDSATEVNCVCFQLCAKTRV